MKNTTLLPEHCIALRWLNYCERYGRTDKISNSHYFQFHIREAEEEGELRSNHRKIDHAETIAIALERLKSGRWPKTLAAFSAIAYANSNPL